MPNARTTLQNLAREFANVIPDVDATAEHERWDPGIGPFEEERQLRMILSTLAQDGNTPNEIEREVGYPGSSRRCDIRVSDSACEISLEAKLLRFRHDNGNIDPNRYKSIFSPFPEQSSSTLLTDARKLAESGFNHPCGLLGIYYEKENEEYEQLRAEKIAEKLELDVEYWYNINIEMVAIERFSGLRHPHHQRGAVISWIIN